MVAERYRSVTAAIDRAWALARPKTLSVGSPATMSRKCPANLWSDRMRAAVRSFVAEPTSAMKRGIRGRLTAIRTALTQSAPATTPTIVTGTMTARNSWGR